MFLTFGVEAVLVFLVTRIAGAPLAFVALFSFIFLFWGEIYSLFSATVGDVFGSKNASANYGMLYTSKGLASVFAGFGAAALAAYFGGSFSVPFYISAVLCGVAAVLALFVLRPLLRRRTPEEARVAEGVALSAALAQASHGRRDPARNASDKRWVVAGWGRSKDKRQEAARPRRHCWLPWSRRFKIWDARLVAVMTV